MKKLVVIALIISAIAGCSEEKGKHLFLLSGQSNMSRMDEKSSFIPTIESHFGKENCIFIKHAFGGQPIRKWVKNWCSDKGECPNEEIFMYNGLLKKTNAAILNQKIQSVTLVWMQGEKDAEEGNGNVYSKSLSNLYQQIQSDLEVDQPNMILGRISTYGSNDTLFPDWKQIRTSIEQFCDQKSHCKYVDTDGFNDTIVSNGDTTIDIHYSKRAYHLLGQRFAEACIQVLSEQ